MVKQSDYYIHTINKVNRSRAKVIFQEQLGFVILQRIIILRVIYFSIFIEVNGVGNGC